MCRWLTSNCVLAIWARDLRFFFSFGMCLVMDDLYEISPSSDSFVGTRCNRHNFLSYSIKSPVKEHQQAMAPKKVKKVAIELQKAKCLWLTYISDFYGSCIVFCPMLLFLPTGNIWTHGDLKPRDGFQRCVYSWTWCGHKQFIINFKMREHAGNRSPLSSQGKNKENRNRTEENQIKPKLCLAGPTRMTE